VGRLVEAGVDERAARPGRGAVEVARRLGGLREPQSRGGRALGEGVARLEHPVVGEVAEQRRACQLERELQVLRAVQGAERLEALDVHLALRHLRDPDAVAAGPQVVGASDSVESDADRPQRASQRRARARVEHAGPELCGDPRAGVRPRVQ
jgi:hypothetical protein